jgi:hypothetical protein
MKTCKKLWKVTDMLEVSEKTFTSVYLSGVVVISDYSCMLDLILLWDKNWYSGEGEDYTYIMHPEVYCNYLKFVRSFEKSCPLLAELR